MKLYSSESKYYYSLATVNQAFQNSTRMDVLCTYYEWLWRAKALWLNPPAPPNDDHPQRTTHT